MKLPPFLLLMNTVASAVAVSLAYEAFTRRPPLPAPATQRAWSGEEYDKYRGGSIHAFEPLFGKPMQVSPMDSGDLSNPPWNRLIPPDWNRRIEERVYLIDSDKVVFLADGESGSIITVLYLPPGSGDYSVFPRGR